MFKLRSVAVLCVLMSMFSLSGCATIMTGTTQKVAVTSNPTGAIAKVDGATASATPALFTLERKSDHTIEISKDGYRTATVSLRHVMSGAFLGNVLIGGIIGMVIDACSGAMYKLVPEKVDVTLERGEVQNNSESPRSAETAVVEPKKDEPTDLRPQ